MNRSFKESQVKQSKKEGEEINKTAQHLKIQLETIMKTQTEGTLEMEKKSR